MLVILGKSTSDPSCCAIFASRFSMRVRSRGGEMLMMSSAVIRAYHASSGGIREYLARRLR